MMTQNRDSSVYTQKQVGSEMIELGQCEDTMKKIEAVVKVKTDKETTDVILGFLNRLRGNITAIIGEKFNELVEKAKVDKENWIREKEGELEAKLKYHSDKLEDAAQQYIAEYCEKFSKDKDAELDEVELRMLNAVHGASEKFVSERLHEKLTEENKEAIAFLVKEALDASKADVHHDIEDRRIEAYNKLYEELQSIKDDEKLSGSIPLNKDRAKMVVGVLSRLPMSRVESYVDDMYNHSDGWSLHYACEDGVWEITSATKVKDLALVDFIRNFRSIVDFSHSSRLPSQKFNQLCEKMFENFKQDHPEQFKRAE